MPKYDVRVSAEADIIELWRVEADSPEDARRIAESDDGLADHDFIENLEVDNERERKVESVALWEDPAPATPGDTLMKVILDIIGYEEPEEDGDIVEAFSDFQNRLQATMGGLAQMNVAAHARDLIDRMGDLIDDAITNHIYDADNGDEVPDDCPYHAAVAESVAFLKVTTPEAPAYEAPPIGAMKVISALEGAISELDQQVGQMEGMFPDDDGTIQQARDDGDEAIALAQSYRAAVGETRTLYISRTENDLSIWSPTPIPGLEITTMNYDIDDIRNYEAADVTMVRFESTDAFEPCLVSTNVLTGSGRAPEMRPATEDDMGDDA